MTGRIKKSKTEINNLIVYITQLLSEPVFFGAAYWLVDFLSVLVTS